MLIGITSDAYPSRRNIIGIVKDAQYKKIKDPYSAMYSIATKMNCMVGRNIFPENDVRFQFNDFNFNTVSLFHFFNVVSYGRTPWVTTFETILPRFTSALSNIHEDKPNALMLKSERKIRKAMQAVSSNSCKRIIALSECNADMQRSFLKFFPQYRESIESKLIVLHPPQKAYVSQYSNKNIGLDGMIKFIFIGSGTFFRKGGGKS